jgi:hypothetical protein
MPNYCTNRVQVSGPTDEVAVFRAACFRTIEDEFCFDFESIAPMPTALKNAPDDPDARHSTSLLRFLAGHELDWSDVYHIRQAQNLNSADLPTSDAARDYLAANPKIADAGKHGMEMTAAHGAMNWYEWRRRFWGTKWNACETGITSEQPLDFLFDTAWGPPLPLLLAASRMYPTLTFNCIFIEESMDFGGERRYQGGITLFEFDDSGTDAIYAKVYGCERELADDDDDDPEPCAPDDELG